MGAVPFEAAVEDLEDGLRAVSIRGELDLESTASLERMIDRIAAAPPTGLLVDLRECEFIDSTGIALIVNTWKRFDGGNGSCPVAICAPGVQVRRVIEITGLTDRIPVYAGREEAREALIPATS